MNAQEIIERIQQHEAALRRIGVRSLMLFGSQVRGDASAESDVDVLYEFEEGAATLDHFVQLRDALEAMLGRRVDLVPARHISPILADRIRDQVQPVLQAAG